MMTIACPSCREQFGLPPALAGKPFTCPSCQTAMTVPRPEEIHRPGPSVKAAFSVVTACLRCSRVLHIEPDKADGWLACPSCSLVFTPAPPAPPRPAPPRSGPPPLPPKPAYEVVEPEELPPAGDDEEDEAKPDVAQGADWGEPLLLPDASTGEIIVGLLALALCVAAMVTVLWLAGGFEDVRVALAVCAGVIVVLALSAFGVSVAMKCGLAEGLGYAAAGVGLVFLAAAVVALVVVVVGWISLDLVFAGVVVLVLARLGWFIVVDLFALLFGDFSNSPPVVAECRLCRRTKRMCAGGYCTTCAGGIIWTKNHRR